MEAQTRCRSRPAGFFLFNPAERADEQTLKVYSGNPLQVFI